MFNAPAAHVSMRYAFDVMQCVSSPDAWLLPCNAMQRESWSFEMQEIWLP
jgi:hypothetical protein